MIGIDLRYMNPIGGIPTAGVDVFVVELLEGFIKMGKQREIKLICYPHQNGTIRNLFPEYELVEVSTVVQQIAGLLTGGRIRGIGTLKRMKAYNKKMEKIGFDLIWFPYGTPDSTLQLQTPSVCTVHDLIMYHEEMAKGIDNGYGAMLQNSSHIITISDFVKQDIHCSFPSLDRPVTVIPNAVKVDISEQEQVAELEGRAYILDINAYQERKNAVTLLKAYATIADKIKQDLVFCGGWKQEGYYEKLEKMIEELGLQQRVHRFCSIPMAQRNWLLANADLFVTPSLSEGFGRTPVEAAICGIPVISSVSDSLQEATMGLLHYYQDATDEAELATLMLQVLQTPQKKEELEQISCKLQTEYAPFRMAEKYWEIFQKVMHG